MSTLTGYQGFAGPSGSLRASQSGRGLQGGVYAPVSSKAPKGYSKVTTQNFSPEQMELFRNLFSQVAPESFLAQLASGSPESFAAIEAPAYKDFQTALGQLGSRFSQLAPGTLGAQKSSGFSLAGSQAAQDFAERLQEKRLGLQRQALSDLSSLSQMLLEQRPSTTDFIQKQPGFLKSLLSGATSGFAGRLFR